MNPMNTTALRGQPIGNVADRLVNIEDRLRSLVNQVERVSTSIGANGPAIEDSDGEGIQAQCKTIRTHAGVLVGCQDKLDVIEAAMARIEGHLGDIETVDNRPTSSLKDAVVGKSARP